MQKERYPIVATSESQVVQNIKLKRDLLQKGDPEHKKFQTAIICGSGIMLGVFGGGVVTGLEKLGMVNKDDKGKDVFDYAIGVSAGSPNLAYFLSGQSEVGTSIYYEELTGTDFINYFRLSKIVDLDYLESVFRERPKQLDTTAIYDSRTRLLITATDATTGIGKFFDIKADALVDIISAVKASLAMPISYNKTVSINGREYCDAGASLPLPIDYAINKLGCTDILVVLHKPYGSKRSKKSQFIEAALAIFYLRKCTPEFRKAFLSRGERYNRVINKLWNNGYSGLGARVSVVCFDKQPVGALCQDGKKLKALARQGEKQILEVFS